MVFKKRKLSEKVRQIELSAQSSNEENTGYKEKVVKELLGLISAKARTRGET